MVSGNHFQPVGPRAIGGKGKYIAEYAAQVGAVLAFQSYQCGWMKLRAPAGKSP